MEGNGRPNIDAEIQTERSLIGGVLRWPQSLCEIAPAIRPDDFRLDAHQRVYRAIVGRWDRGRFVDLASLADDLKKSGDLEDVGGYVYLAELFESEPTGAHSHQHAALVRERSILRSLAAAGSEITHDATSPTGPAEEMLAIAERRVMDIASVGMGDTTTEFGQTLQEALARIDDRRKHGGRASGVPTGFYDLDAIISGLQPSELVIVAARPSIGKTSLGMSFAVAAARACVPVLFVTLEQSKSELGERFICQESRVDSHRIRTSTMTGDDYDAILSADQTMCKLPIIIDDYQEQTALRIGSTARRAKRRWKIGMVVVDYLQLISADDHGLKRYEQIGVVTRRLKMLAKELAIPVVVMCQLSRESEAREPRLSDLRESGNIEQDADVVILMHRLELTPGPVQEVVVHVAKNRNGRCGRLSLSFVRHCTRFENAGIPR